ncbi:MAG: hypothetical protein M5U28_42955 [Sandaracinaceae bacterium]|nr:hypothetical protein [Sandaracinaceae bacterium]
MPRLALVSLSILALAACGGPPAGRAPEPAAGTPRLAERARAVHAAFDPSARTPPWPSWSATSACAATRAT